MTHLTLVDVNVEEGPSPGCLALHGWLGDLAPQLEVNHRHWSEGLRDAHEALMLGPNGTPFAAYPSTFGRFLEALRQHRGPIIGVCGGHQVMGLAHGASVAPVAEVPAAKDSYEGMPKLSGLTTLRLLSSKHPVFRGLPSEFQLFASHVDELKSLPEGFVHLATSQECDLQLIAHERYKQLGIQCHPERPAAHPEGRRLVRNWLRWAGLAT